VAGAESHVLAGRFADAEAALRKKELRDDPHAVFALARLYIEWLRSLDADRVLERGAALVGETHPDTQGHRGLALLLRGERAEGLGLLRAAAGARDPGAWPARLAEALLDAGDAKAAVATLEAARKGSSDREASFLLGRALLGAGEPPRALEVFRGISTADTRWASWDGDAWLALALASVGSQPDLEAAAAALERVPEARRGSAACLRARIAVLEKGGSPEDLSAARSALARHDALEAGARDLGRRIASAPWPGSAPLYRELARLEAARGLESEAVRWARLAIHADPASADALRELAGWLRGEGEVFYRLRALRDLLRLAPGDAQAQAEVARLEAAWLATPPRG
jgi:tetratricopeptide (TPR) repeat protein